jgi:hypothetical protein
MNKTYVIESSEKVGLEIFSYLSNIGGSMGVLHRNPSLCIQLAQVSDDTMIMIKLKYEGLKIIEGRFGKNGKFVEIEV